MSDCTCWPFPDRLCFCHLPAYPHRTGCNCECPEGWPTRQVTPQPYLPAKDTFHEQVIAVIHGDHVEMVAR